MSTRRVPTPTCIFVFMLLMSPGKVSARVSGTETTIVKTIIAAMARRRASSADVVRERMHSLHHMYTFTFHEADTSSKRRP
ncbi:hypothetical protein BJV77DRAFT_999879 [Russula vinacea]|nr:hypothetical protein BJV77DRAFT_999879 [Russula vinacea]